MGHKYKKQVSCAWGTNTKSRCHGAQIQKAGVMGYKYKKQVSWGTNTKNRCHGVQIQKTGVMGHKYKKQVSWGTNTNYRFLWFKNKIQVSAIKIKTTC